MRTLTKLINVIANSLNHTLKRIRRSLQPKPIVKIKYVFGNRKTKFYRCHLKFYNSLRCVPDVENVISMKAKNICNVVAAFKAYQKYFDRTKAHMQDSSVLVWAPNMRMRVFLQHMTKWQVEKDMPTEPFMYFGVNPPRKELEDLETVLATNKASIPAFVVVGTDPGFLKKITPSVGNFVSSWDQGILGPNKFVTVS